MVQPTKNRTRHYTAMCRQSMSLLLQGSQQRHERLGNTRPQGHVRTAVVIMLHPCRQKPSQVVCRQGNHEIHAFLPERAQQPLTQGIGLGTLGRRFEDLDVSTLFRTPHLVSF